MAAEPDRSETAIPVCALHPPVPSRYNRFMAKLSKLTKFLDKLDDADLHYTLTSIREGAVLVSITVPDERWEVEFAADGDVEVEIFKKDGEIHGEPMLKQLFEHHTEA